MSDTTDVPNVMMPFFGFTAAEKAENEFHINSLLDQCGALLDESHKRLSFFDLRDAFVTVRDAMFIAQDPGACEFPPLAKCYLYLGHVMRDMKQYQAAHDAYQAASESTAYSSVDCAVPEQAAAFATEMEKKVRDGKRRGKIWSSVSRDNSSCIDIMQPRYERLDGHPELASFHHSWPLIKQANAEKTPCIQEPEIHNIAKPQRLVQCNGGWTAEEADTPSLNERVGMSMRCLTPDLFIWNAKENLSIIV
ncbi:hypothetical protein F4677DRAFT_462743 [Hypoxylon crocopeplum]|nr:hypothetical protein F4677DRAFT_462743 [Hypoxylon crocopeplum]